MVARKACTLAGPSPPRGRHGAAAMREWRVCAATCAKRITDPSLVSRVAARERYHKLPRTSFTRSPSVTQTAFRGELGSLCRPRSERRSRRRCRLLTVWLHRWPRRGRRRGRPWRRGRRRLSLRAIPGRAGRVMDRSRIVVHRSGCLLGRNGCLVNRGGHVVRRRRGVPSRSLVPRGRRVAGRGGRSLAPRRRTNRRG